MGKMEFRGRHVLITGASSGLGLAMAKELARTHGAHLVLVARRRDRLEALREELEKSYGVQVAVIVADMTRSEDVERVFQEATAGRELYAAILNAGVTFFGHALEIPAGELEALIQTNVGSTVRLANAFARHLIERKNGGGVMLVSSVAGVSPLPYQAAYAASKAFLNSYGQALAEELRGSGVSISTFVPGSGAGPRSRSRTCRGSAPGPGRGSRPCAGGSPPGAGPAGGRRPRRPATPRRCSGAASRPGRRAAWSCRCRWGRRSPRAARVRRPGRRPGARRGAAGRRAPSG